MPELGERPVGKRFTTPGGYGTQVGILGDPIDELPVDGDQFQPDHEPSLLESGEYRELAEFLAFIQSSRIDAKGQLVLTVGVPYEYKYEAMPLTDLRGLVFVLKAYQPVKKPGVAAKNGNGG